MTSPIAPCLWFDTEALDAAEYYCSIFPEARILNVSHYGEAGPREAGLVMMVEWEMAGQRFLGLNGGPDYSFTEAISFTVTCESQAEVDRYWDELTCEGAEGPCGWCKDRYGVSWQIVPKGMAELFGDQDRERAQRAMAAMLNMGKLDIDAIRAAADGVGV